MVKLFFLFFIAGCANTADISKNALLTPADAARWHAISSFKDTAVFLDTVIRVDRETGKPDTFWRVRAHNN